MSHHSSARTPVLSRLRKICASRLAASILAALLAMSICASLLRFDLSSLVVQPQIAEVRQQLEPFSASHLAGPTEQSGTWISTVHSA